MCWQYHLWTKWNDGSKDGMGKRDWWIRQFLIYGLEFILFARMVGMQNLFRILQRIFSVRSILFKPRLTLFLQKPYVRHWTLSEFMATKLLPTIVQYLCMMPSYCLRCGMKLTKSWEHIRRKIITSRIYFTKITNLLLEMKLYLITV
jgi:hypothetical protein